MKAQNTVFFTATQRFGLQDHLRDVAKTVHVHMHVGPNFVQLRDPVSVIVSLHSASFNRSVSCVKV